MSEQAGRPEDDRTTGGRTPPATVSRGWLIGIGIAVVVLSFVAAFLGASLAGSGDVSETVASPSPTAEEGEAADEAAYEEALDEILPAGSAVRAGTGAPEAGKGYEGDVYIDLDTSDVYLFQDGEWTRVGNIRTSAAENLTGATGPQGEQGAQGAQGEHGEQGEQGEQGEAGAPGTQVTLGVGAPEPEKCTTDGDVYIDTEVVAFYECRGGSWTLFGPSEAPPTTAPDEG